MSADKGIIFVCLGNINRSTVAEAILRSYRPALAIKSAGTGGHFAGRPASSEMQQAAAKRGLDLSNHRAKQVTIDDMASHGLVIAMDSENLGDLERKCPAEHRHKLRLFLPYYAPQLNLSDTPDPYYVGGYDRVVDIVEEGILGLIQKEGL